MFVSRQIENVVKCASSKLVDDARKEELRAEKAAAEGDDGF